MRASIRPWGRSAGSGRSKLALPDLSGLRTGSGRAGPADSEYSADLTAPETVAFPVRVAAEPRTTRMPGVYSWESLPLTTDARAIDGGLPEIVKSTGATGPACPAASTAFTVILCGPAARESITAANASAAGRSVAAAPSSE